MTSSGSLKGIVYKNGKLKKASGKKEETSGGSLKGTMYKNGKLKKASDKEEVTPAGKKTLVSKDFDSKTEAKHTSRLQDTTDAKTKTGCMDAPATNFILNTWR